MSRALAIGCLLITAFGRITVCPAQEALLEPIPAGSTLVIAAPVNPPATTAQPLTSALAPTVVMAAPNAAGSRNPATVTTPVAPPPLMIPQVAPGAVTNNAEYGNTTRFLPEVTPTPPNGCGCGGGGYLAESGVGFGSAFGGIPYSPGCLDLHGCPKPPLLYQSPRGAWYVESELVALKRDGSDRRRFASLGTTTSDVLNIDDLQFENQGGMRILVGNQFNDCFAFEASYLGLMDWDETRAIRNTTTNILGSAGNLFSPFTNFGAPPVVGLDFNNFASIRVQSSLDNAEINIRQRLSTPPSMMQATALYGFRYMRIQERFEYRTQSALPTPAGTANSVDVDTGNHLYGFQLGGMIELRVEPKAWISFEYKGAICHNEASQNTVFATGPLVGPGVPVNGSRAEDRTAFVGDVSLAAEYKFTPRIFGRIGYQAMIVDGLALASENFEQDINILNNGPARLVHDGSIVYHGPFVGLTTTW